MAQPTPAEESERRAHPDIVALQDALDDGRVATRSEGFAKDLIGKFVWKGHLSPKQWMWVEKLGAVVEERTETRADSLRAVKDTLEDRDKKFAGSLLGQWDAKGRLSDKQWAWVVKLTDKAVATPAGSKAAAKKHKKSPKTAPAPPVVIDGYEGVDEFFSRSSATLKQAKVHLFSKDNITPEETVRERGEGDDRYAKVYTPSWHEVVVRTKRRASEDSDTLYVYGETKKVLDRDASLALRRAWKQEQRDEATAKGNGDPFAQATWELDENKNPKDGAWHTGYRKDFDYHKTGKKRYRSYRTERTKPLTRAGPLHSYRLGTWLGDGKRPPKPLISQSGGGFYGTIDRTTCKFYPTKLAESKDDVMSVMEQFRMDPVEATVRLGKKGGRCSFCSKGLTDHRSTSHGYGPTCAKHYGLPWSKDTAIEIEDSIDKEVKLRLIQMRPGVWAVIDLDTNEVMITYDNREAAEAACTVEWGEDVIYVPDND